MYGVTLDKASAYKIQSIQEYLANATAPFNSSTLSVTENFLSGAVLKSLSSVQLKTSHAPS